MNLLTWHGTILRTDAAGQWFHEVLWPQGEGLADLELAVPEGGLAAPLLLGDIVAASSRHPGRITLRRGEMLLRADPFAPALAFERHEAGQFEQFLPLPAESVARLRAVLGSTRAEGQAQLRNGCVLHLDGRDFALDGATVSGSGDLVLDGIALSPGAPRAVPPRIVLRRRVLGLPVAIDADMFAKGPAKRLDLPSHDELAFPPATLCDADQVWMQQNPWSPVGQSWGRVTPRNAIMRTRNAYVLMSRGQEGTIFDRTGLFTDIGHFSRMAVKGAGHLSRSGETILVDEAALQHAPFLPGPHAVFYGGTLTNYFHWLMEGLIPLRILAPHLPPDTRLLLPECLAAMRHAPGGDLLPDHLGMLADWGFGHMQHSTIAAPLCQAEEIYWLEGMNLDLIAGADLRAARQIVMPSGPAPAARRRLYVRRPAGRSVLNADALEHALAQAGFETVEMRGMSHRDQIALFASAAFVVAPHGAEMSNLLFCQPGTRIIELSPIAQFRPFFAQISDKLGLSHAVLPCATDDHGFQGRMTVDLKRLAALMELVMLRDPARP